MMIRFVKPVWIALKNESERTGKTIPALVHDIVAQHFKIAPVK